MRYSRRSPAAGGAGHALPAVTLEFLGSVSSTIDPPILSIVLREPSCLETHEIGAHANQLILYGGHACRQVLKAAQDRVELGIDLPKHSQRQIFEFVNHIRPQYTRAFGSKYCTSLVMV